MLTISQLSQFLKDNQADFEIIQHNTHPILSGQPLKINPQDIVRLVRITILPNECFV